MSINISDIHYLKKHAKLYLTKEKWFKTIEYLNIHENDLENF